MRVLRPSGGSAARDDARGSGGFSPGHMLPEQGSCLFALFFKVGRTILSCLVILMKHRRYLLDEV